MSVREEFEDAYVRDLVGNSLSAACEWLERGSDGEYRSFQARGAWWAWQASRAALVVELPFVSDSDLIEFKGECREAVESVGITVRS